MSMTIICTLSPSISAHIYDHQTFICFTDKCILILIFNGDSWTLSSETFVRNFSRTPTATNSSWHGQSNEIENSTGNEKKNKLVLPYVFCLSCKSCLIIGFSNIIIQMLRFYAFLFTRFCLTNIDLINMYQLLNVCRYYWKLTVLLLSLLL